MIFAKVVAMRCDKDFIKGCDLWTANIQHGLFRRETVTARSSDPHNFKWNIVGTGRHSGEPGVTVWCMLVDRCTAMKEWDITSWGSNGRVVKPAQ